ncbi:hypothetical protein [Oceanospirillum beijerinckii]|uniref:hypothetical protein n=1 Tax=Oceanospirillum beijerinckii TaxID=64976 RepID=UPI000482AB0E|nr:hypothetical protein [Oceanospirillum beijerinckii]
MSSISISVSSPVVNLELVKKIRNVTGISISYISNRLKEGVFYTTELFLNDHATKDLEIRTILSAIEEYGLDPFIMEISDDQEWDDVRDFDSYRIRPKELIDVLNEFKDDFN